MFPRLFLPTPSVLLWTLGTTPQASGVPLPSESLKVGTVIDIGKELPARSSMYNPRSFGGKNYLVQINAPQRAVGCYPAGSTNYEALANIKDGAEVRMAGAFPAANYVLLAGGAENDYFSRIDPNLSLTTRAFAKTPAVMPSSYDWVDEDTVIHTSYKSGLRANLYLTDIKPDPFQVTANPSWNADGYVPTAATTRIRNVRVGDHYKGYAYYGDSGVKTAGFWAINLATGVSTPLGTLAVTGDGSWGLWTVKEVDGFLYVHTTHDGIYVFTLTDATTLGPLHTRYTKESLDRGLKSKERVMRPPQEDRQAPMSLARLWLMLGFVCVLTVPATARDLAGESLALDAPVGGICSYEFLDLDDPCALRDVAGNGLLTFGGFDANDRLVWVNGFESIDAWRAYARNDPCLADDRTEQVGWALSGGKEDIFWQLQALIYLCPEYRNIIGAIESRPSIYDGNRKMWLVPGIELTGADNRFDLSTTTIFWNPSVTTAAGGAQPWDKFPPLVALAHELVHAYQRIVEDKTTYASSLQIPAIKEENLIRHAFYRRVPGYGDIKPRPGNAGFYQGPMLQYLFDTVEWADWPLSYAPLLDVFMQQEPDDP